MNKPLLKAEAAITLAYNRILESHHIDIASH